MRAKKRANALITGDAETRDRDSVERPRGNIAIAVRFFRRMIQGRDGRVGPKASIAEGGPLAHVLVQNAGERRSERTL